MFKRIFTVLFLLIGFGSYIYGQTYNGPDSGGVASGAMVSTDNFSKVLGIGNPNERIGEDEFEINQETHPIDFGFPTPEEGSNYHSDPSLNGRSVNQSVILRDFQGIPDQGFFIPPDPYCAAGPDNFVAVVNSRFRIFDKYGNELKTINADSWFENVFPGGGSFDPKVTYDAIDQRWIMVWLQQDDASQTANLLLSVSDDSDPMGTWYNWALPANLSGTINTNTWSDYQGVGYDENAIYITSSQFSFTGFYQYTKIRVIPKAQLYDNTAGSVSWNDLWNIALSGSGSPFHLRPAIMHTNSSKYYLLYAPNPNTGNVNYFSLYSITDPLGTPVLSGVNIPVTAYSQAPNANQLGGSSMLIETGGSGGQNEPKFRDGYLYFVHSVRNPSNAAYSTIHFVKINVNTNTADQDFVFGNTGYWYFYPSMDVDKDDNVAVTYSRSGTNEYIGAYYSTRLAGDPAGFSGSVPLKPGEANYVKDFGGGRNRWGDYTGVQIDPINQNNFWIFSEYAASPANTWGSWVGEIRAVQYTGPHFYVRDDILKFGSVEVDSVSGTKSVTLYNYGTDDINVTNIPSSVGPFQVINNPGNVTITPLDSIILTLQFAPTSNAYFNDTLNIESNDPDFSGVELTGTGYIINPVVQGTMYASTGENSEGKLLEVNLLTGAADSIGSSLHDDVNFISKVSINPKTFIMYGLLEGTISSDLVRVNASAGDAYTLFTINLDHLVDAVFDTSGEMYTVQSNGKIYSVDLSDGSTTYISNAGVNINAIAFDPTNNDLYGTSKITIGSNKDRIYRINLLNGGATVIGNTGFGKTNNDLEFDADGNLYGVIGASTEEGQFISIDKTTGAGTSIGMMGFNDVTGLAFAIFGVTGVQAPSSNTLLPKDYTLQQNYPNPFNPSTTIEYTLPINSNVKVTIYNLLGEVVNTLVDGEQNAGSHMVNWNSSDAHGSKVGSGVYFYELKANGSNGSQFTQIRKMILLK